VARGWGDAKTSAIATLANTPFAIVAGGILQMSGALTVAGATPAFLSYDAVEAAAETEP
jgi:hypothetical protein